MYIDVGNPYETNRPMQLAAAEAAKNFWGDKMIEELKKAFKKYPRFEVEMALIEAERRFYEWHIEPFKELINAKRMFLYHKKEAQRIWNSIKGSLMTY